MQEPILEVGVDSSQHEVDVSLLNIEARPLSEVASRELSLERWASLK